MIKRTLLLLALLVIPALAVPATVGAVDVFDEQVCAKYEGQSNASKPTVCRDKEISVNGEQQNPLFGNRGIITTIINILTAIVAIVAVITIILAGLRFITSGSNPQDVSKSREQIIYAVIGLIIASLAQVLVRFILSRLED